MRPIRGVALGAAFGVLLVAAFFAGEHQKLLRSRDAVASGLELFAPGATTWRPLATTDGTPVSAAWLDAQRRLLVTTQQSALGSYWDGTRWVPTEATRTLGAYHPTIVGTGWTELAVNQWLSAKTGECTPRREPGGVTLPALPHCNPERFEYQIRAGTLLDDGSVLVVSEEESAHRTYRWRPGDAAWHDEGAVPVGANFATLVAGVGGQAVLTTAQGDIVLYRDATWRLLPKTTSNRYGWQAALAADGSVLAFGGYVDHEAADRGVELALIALVLVAFGAVLVVGKRRWQLPARWLVIGLPLGVGLALATGFVMLVVLYRGRL